MVNVVVTFVEFLVVSVVVVGVYCGDSNGELRYPQWSVVVSIVVTIAVTVIMIVAVTIDQHIFV